MSWKPQGYNSASPYLIVRDAEKGLVFLEAVFGAERLRIHRHDDGSGRTHAEARIDDSVIMMGEGDPASDALVHIYVPDPDAVYARALEVGAEEIQPMSRSGDGDYRGGVSDGNGVQWWIARQEDGAD